MKRIIALLLAVGSLTAFDAKAHEAREKEEWVRDGRQMMDELASKHPYVKTEEGVELMEVVARFADNTVFNDSLAPRYQKDCDEWFAAWRKHPAVTWLHNQLPKYGIGYEAVPWFGAHLRCTEKGLDVIPNVNKEYKRWPKKAVKESDSGCWHFAAP